MGIVISPEGMGESPPAPSMATPLGPPQDIPQGKECTTSFFFLEPDEEAASSPPPMAVSPLDCCPKKAACVMGVTPAITATIN